MSNFVVLAWFLLLIASPALQGWLIQKLTKLDKLISAANKDQSMVNYHQSLVIDCSYLSRNDRCSWLLFQVIFFINIIFTLI